MKSFHVNTPDPRLTTVLSPPREREERYREMGGGGVDGRKEKDVGIGGGGKKGKN